MNNEVRQEIQWNRGYIIRYLHVERAYPPQESDESFVLHTCYIFSLIIPIKCTKNYP